MLEIEAVTYLTLERISVLIVSLMHVNVSKELRMWMNMQDCCLAYSSTFPYIPYIIQNLNNGVTRLTIL